MTIKFYLNDEAETEITSFYEMVSNPFAVNNIVDISVEDLSSTQFTGFSKDTQLEISAKNKTLQLKFNKKRVKLLREGKYIRFNKLSEPKVTIEYHCIIVNY